MRTKKKNIFIQDTGILTDEILVITGMVEKETIEWLKKNKVKKEFISWIKEDIDFNKITENKGCVWFNNDFLLLMLRDFEDTWEFWETVLHEVVHLVQRLKQRKEVVNEDEFEAYLTEYLFQNIRRKLQGIKTY